MEISTAIKALENRRRIEAEIWGSKKTFDDYICYKFAQLFFTIPRVIKIDLKKLGYSWVDNCGVEEQQNVVDRIDEAQSHIVELDSADKLAEFGIWRYHELPDDWDFIGNKAFKFEAAEDRHRFKIVAQDIYNGMHLHIALLYAQKEKRVLSVKECTLLNQMRIIKYAEEEWNAIEDCAYNIFSNPYFPKNYLQMIARELTGVSGEILKTQRPEKKRYTKTNPELLQKEELKKEIYRKWKEENATQVFLAEYAARILGKDKMDRRTISNWIAEMKVEDGFDGRIRNMSGKRKKNSLAEKSKEFVAAYDEIKDRQISYYDYGKEVGISREDVRRYLKKQGRSE